MQEAIKLPLREWLELGQAMVDRSPLGPRYFRKWHTAQIVIGDGMVVEADGKFYIAGSYVLEGKR